MLQNLSRASECAERWCVAVSLASLVLFATSVGAQSGVKGRPSVAALELDEPITVDGRLDEPAWRAAARATGFIQREPREGMPATERTEFSIAYTESTLFVALWAFDASPEKVIAKEMERDARLWADDSVIFAFDTFLDGRNAFAFATNPNGVRHDALVTDEGRDVNREWDGVWATASRRTAEGWVAEIAIPFSTLRFDPSLDRWGLNVQRLIRHKNEEVHWAPLPREVGGFSSSAVYRMSLAGELTGLDGLRPSRSLDVKPYLLASAAQGPRAEGTDTTADGGLDVKWGVTRTLTLDLTYNTDFAEVEVDDLRVNLTRFSLFFPEKRDFFLENAGIFEFGAVQRAPWEPALMKGFFSRRIGLDGGETVPLEAGARLTGRVGAWNVGVLGVGTDGVGFDDRSVPRTGFRVGRVKRNLGARSSIGAIYTQKDPQGGGTESLFGVDFDFKPTQHFELNGFWSQSDKPGVRGDDPSVRGDNVSYGAGFQYQGSTLTTALDLVEVEKNFDPAVGFLPREDFRLVTPRFLWQPRIERHGIRSWMVEGVQRRFERSSDGRLESERIYLAPLGMNFESQDFWQIGYSRNKEQLFAPFEIYPGVVIPPGLYEFDGGSAFFSTSGSRPVGYNGSWNWGDFYDGEWLSMSNSLHLRLSRFVSARTSWLHNDVELPQGDFTIDLWSQGVDLAFTPDLRLNMIAQYNEASGDLGVNVRFHWIYKPGADIFLVYNENWTAPSLSDRSSEGRQLILKVTYLWQR